MRIALAVELEVPDGTNVLTLELTEPVVKLGPTFDRLPSRVVRYEIHPDPDAIFAPEGED